jgi:protein dispatched 1
LATSANKGEDSPTKLLNKWDTKFYNPERSVADEREEKFEIFKMEEEDEDQEEMEGGDWEKEENKEGESNYPFDDYNIENSRNNYANKSNLDLGQKPTAADEKGDELEFQELTSTEKFFHDFWNKWMEKYKFIFFALTIIWIGLAIWRVTLFKSAKDPIQRLSDNHYLQKLTYMSRNDFHSALNTGDIEVNFIWGVKDLNRNGVGRWDPDDLGTLIYDEEFNLAPTANQQRILDIWNDLKTRKLVSNQAVTCWVQDFVNAQNGGSPVPEANFYTELENYLATTTGQSQYTNNLIGYVNGKLLFIRIIALTVEARFQGYDKLYPVYEDWEQLKDTYNKNSPAGVNNAIQSAGYDWAWLVTEREMTRGAIQGIIISLWFALFVLILSTYNIIISIYAVSCIGVIVLSTIAIMEIWGWGLGVIEAIAMVMIIGFSVDYVVHLANHYVEWAYEDRFRRMQDSLTGIGISVVSGAISTIASGIFLFFAVIIFFLKFAVLVLSTITFSLYCSLVLFTWINLFIGPQKHFGDIKYYIVQPLKAKLKKWCCNWMNRQEKIGEKQE